MPIRRRNLSGASLRQIWENAPQGEFHTPGFTGKKDKKMLTLAEDVSPEEMEKRLSTYVTVFPHPRHFDTVSSHIDSLRAGGPAEFNPNAVGTLRVDATRSPKGKKVYSVSFAQAHYTTGEGGVPRSFATKHHGWRLRAMREAIRLSKRHDSELWLPYRVFARARAGEKEGTYLMLEDFKEACRKEGVRAEFVQKDKENIHSGYLVARTLNKSD